MIRRYTASADNTIVSAYQMNLQTRGTGANAGMADILETFSIYGRVTTSSQELSRILVKFPVAKIRKDRLAGKIPASGSVNFYLNLYNAPSSKTVPRNYKILVRAVTRDWEEGDGLDLEGYKDLTYSKYGSNWIRASEAAAWTSVGGDYRNKPQRVQQFVGGTGNLKVKVTKFVEDWIKNITGSKFIPNYGFGIHLSGGTPAAGATSPSYEASSSAKYVRRDSNVILNPKGAEKSYYTKRFFARGSQYFFFRPNIEARWNSTKADDRGNFFFSSSRAPASENLNTLYFYNIVRGKLVDLPGGGLGPGTTGKLVVSLFSGSKDNTIPSGSGVTRTPLTLDGGKIFATASHVSTGIYSCNVCLLSSSVKTVYDVWFSGSDDIGNPNKAKQYFTGSFKPLIIGGGESTSVPSYYLSLTNLKPKYLKNDTARLNLFVRKKNWSPTIYTVASSKIESETIISASYKVYRILDGYPAIPYGTGSDYHTGLSYDISGNYFDLDMKLLEPGYAYGIRFAFYDERNVAWNEQPETFKFRVEDYEY